jgi:uncharacterized protein YdeI (YjbR/CyaY-like superfamily)
MKVPYAAKWSSETDQLRKIALRTGLTEQKKWGKPCFTWQGKNVAIVIPLKESCAFMFTKGALLKDPKRLLGKVGENSQSNRWMKFTTVKEIAARKSAVDQYLREAIKVEESGRKVARKKLADYQIPEALQARLKSTPKLRTAFARLTPGRQKSWILHIAGAKQEKTRAARVEKAAPMILKGRGFNERPS